MIGIFGLWFTVYGLRFIVSIVYD